MGDEWLDCLLLLASEKDLTDKIDLSTPSWANLKQRRIRVAV